LAKETDDVSFVGRLAQYRYYNMDQCVGAALKAAESLAARFGAQEPRSGDTVGRVHTHAGTGAVAALPGLA
jgi:hypothetical protein